MMLTSITKSDAKLEFLSPFGNWHVSRKNFSAISDRFRLVFENGDTDPDSPPFFAFPTISVFGYSGKTTALIKAFTRHPNSTLPNLAGTNPNTPLSTPRSTKSGTPRTPQASPSPRLLPRSAAPSVASSVAESTFLMDKEVLDFDKNNVVGFYQFCCIWGIKRARSVAAKYILDTFEVEDMVKIYEDFYSKGTEAPEIESFFTSNFRSLLNFFAELPPVLLDRIFNKCKFEPGDDDLLVEYSLTLPNQKRSSVLRYCNMCNCSLHSLMRFSQGGFVATQLEDLMDVREKLFKALWELKDAKDEIEKVKKDSDMYLRDIQRLLLNEHGYPEFDLLMAEREKKIEIDELINRDDLLQSAVDLRIPEALFERAKEIETGRSVEAENERMLQKSPTPRSRSPGRSPSRTSQRTPRKGSPLNSPLRSPRSPRATTPEEEELTVQAYEELLETHNEQSDELLAARFLELTRLRNKNVLIPLLNKFVKESDRPRFLLAAYQVSQLDSRTVTVPVGEKCLKKAADSGLRQAERAYAERLARGKERLRRRAAKFISRKSEEYNDGEFDFALGTCRLFGIGLRKCATRAMEHFLKAAKAGFNVANLVLAATAKTARERSNYFGDFVSGGRRIEPRTYFVCRTVLGLFDEISVRLEGLEEPLLELVTYLVTEAIDPEATEFLFRRSPDLLRKLQRRALPKFDPEELEEILDTLRKTPTLKIALPDEANSNVAGDAASAMSINVIKERQFAENESDELEFVRLPEYIKSVGDRSFEKCRTLRAIALENGPIEIGAYAFAKCSTLRAIFMPPSIARIGEACFRKCKDMVRIALPPNIREIPNRTFAFCEKLREVELPSLIDQSTKQQSENDEEMVDLNEFMKSENKKFTIGVDAFEGCKALEICPLNNDVGSLGDGAFQFCDSLKIVIIPKSIGHVPSRAFRYCGQLRAVLIEDGVTRIDNDAFHGCKELGFVSIPRSGFEKIGPDAFTDCPRLHSVTLPRGCKVHRRAFDEDVAIEHFEDREEGDIGEEEEEETE
ncbi:hypothetical protein TRFO_38204 [Tritrichomonas foetus]|uniref:Leucine Rich Repeat family protein n=1 Tax=Tritrichomonas foetus TaxID=1144522 RepID=A0A1J4J902_9EUKA|nr:hypothetical protein TRFO_38204 [Tritrichomonas foetus]|eukprot:OHS95666.1 hypothetical protein TRFO_38204 [Tritrichomonas foetus]